MKYSDTTNKDGILQQIEKITGLGDAVITGSTANLAYWTLKVNDWLSYVTHWIHEVTFEWPYDDNNNTGLPIEVFTPVNGQADYGLNTNGEMAGLAISRVEVRDATTQDYYDVQLMANRDIPEDTFGEDAGTPSHYRLNGGSIIFYPKFDTAKADAYRITYDRGAHAFVVGDTTAQPGFNQDYHSILIYGAIMDWAGEKGSSQAQLYTTCKNKLFGDGQIPGLKKMLQDFYSKRNKVLNKSLKRKYYTPYV